LRLIGSRKNGDLPEEPCWNRFRSGYKSARLAPGQVGLYEVRAIAPADAAAGDAVPVTLTVAGQTSPPVTMAIR